jgi:hypothetical protein
LISRRMKRNCSSPFSGLLYFTQSFVFMFSVCELARKKSTQNTAFSYDSASYQTLQITNAANTNAPNRHLPRNKLQWKNNQLQIE